MAESHNLAETGSSCVHQASRKAAQRRYFCSSKRQISKLPDHSKAIMTDKKSSKPFSFAEKITIVWFLIDAFTHLTIELGYVYLALGETARKSDSYLGHIWREYGRADARWAVRDANVISIEILTVLVGVLCLFMIYGTIYRAPWRHVLQMVVCVAELYGGWMTFAPEWIEGSPNLNGSSFELLWIYLFFMNGLWVVVPALLLWDSAARLTEATGQLAHPIDSGTPSGAPSKTMFYLMAGQPSLC